MRMPLEMLASDWSTKYVIWSLQVENRVMASFAISTTPTTTTILTSVGVFIYICNCYCCLCL